MESKEPIFKDISGETDVPEITEIESLCMQCHENGTTRILLTKIPFFKEIVIMSFSCPHCHFKDNEIKPASEIQIQGVRYTLKVDGVKMMSRQLVKQASAMFRIEELDFEAPEFTSKGGLTTIEGLFVNAIEGLEQQQPVRRAIDPDLAQKVDNIINSLDKYKSGEIPFTLILEDISGNSFVENPFAPKEDPSLKTEFFDRTRVQDSKLGIAPDGEEEEKEEETVTEKKDETEVKEINENIKDEVLEFPGNCPKCQTPTITKMKILDIPHFKEVVIMAFTCDSCGDKSNEVKAGGGIEEFGTRIIFKITDPTDLSRDVLTSETCTVSIKEFDLDLCHSSEGGKFTTVEGLLTNMIETLGKINPFAFGDSSEVAEKDNTMKKLKRDIQSVIDSELMVTLVLDDPVGNSYLQNTYAPEDDPNLTIEKYTRTKEQEDDFGLSDMKIDNYT